MVSSEVQAYAAIQNGYSDTPYQLHSLRLIRPDDSVSSKLLLCLPSTVVHEIDAWSPLSPPTKASTEDAFPDMSAYSYKWPSSRQRFDDSTNNNRACFFCIVCGESFPSESVLRRHASMTAAVELAGTERGDQAHCLACGESVAWKSLGDHYDEKHPDVRIETLVYNEHWTAGLTFNHANTFDCRGCRHDGFANVGPPKYTREEIKEWMERCQPEVICILGAVDVATGSNFETQHSYTLDDIEWDMQHKPCVYPDPKSHIATVDFQAFLETIDAPAVPEGGLADDIQFHL